MLDGERAENPYGSWVWGELGGRVGGDRFVGPVPVVRPFGGRSVAVYGGVTEVRFGVIAECLLIKGFGC